MPVAILTKLWICMSNNSQKKKVVVKYSNYLWDKGKKGVISKNNPKLWNALCNIKITENYYVNFNQTWNTHNLHPEKNSEEVRYTFHF